MRWWGWKARSSLPAEHPSLMGTCSLFNMALRHFLQLTGHVLGHHHGTGHLLDIAAGGMAQGASKLLREAGYWRVGLWTPRSPGGTSGPADTVNFLYICPMMNWLQLSCPSCWPDARETLDATYQPALAGAYPKSDSFS